MIKYVFSTLYENEDIHCEIKQRKGDVCVAVCTLQDVSKSNLAFSLLLKL